jgi:prepilin-type N-terminal cleavage/methylation domain-containing protein
MKWLPIRPPAGRQGFTLIEIIVSVMLILILSGLLVAGYNGYTSTQSITQAAVTLKSNLRSVRTSAISGMKPANCDTLVGYTITFPSATTYRTSGVCMVGGVQQATGTTASYQLPPGVTFSPVPQTITFYSINQAPTVAQNISLVSQSKTVTIQVSANGMVEYSPTPTP